MPITREEHIIYTRNELETYKYYVDIFLILKNENIESYIDIGANIGEYCNIINKKLPTLKKSFLFEPEIKNFNFLKKHVNLDINFECYNFGIGYNFKNPILKTSSNVGGFFISDSLNDEFNSVKVKTLEELNLPNVDLIKIDIEGGEFNIIENSTYFKSVKWLEIEFHQTKEQVKEGFIPKYLKNNLQDYELIVFDTNIENLYGRCLLKRIKDI